MRRDAPPKVRPINLGASAGFANVVPAEHGIQRQEAEEAAAVQVLRTRQGLSYGPMAHPGNNCNFYLQAFYFFNNSRNYEYTTI